MNVSPVRSVAQVVATTSGDYVKLIGKRGTGSGWTNETGVRASTATPTLAQVRPSKPGYRAGAVWMMKSTTAAAIRKLKDSDGRSLWADSLAEGQPSRLLGYPVATAEDMPDIGAGSLSIAFGNFERGYLIADRAGTTMVRDEVTQPGFIKLYVARRVGGTVADSNAIKLVKFAVS